MAPAFGSALNRAMLATLPRLLLLRRVPHRRLDCESRLRDGQRAPIDFHAGRAGVAWTGAEQLARQGTFSQHGRAGILWVISGYVIWSRVRASAVGGRSPTIPAAHRHHRRPVIAPGLTASASCGGYWPGLPAKVPQSLGWGRPWVLAAVVLGLRQGAASLAELKPWVLKPVIVGLPSKVPQVVGAAGVRGAPIRARVHTPTAAVPAQPHQRRGPSRRSGRGGRWTPTTWAQADHRRPRRRDPTSRPTPTPGGDGEGTTAPPHGTTAHRRRGSAGAGSPPSRAAAGGASPRSPEHRR